MKKTQIKDTIRNIRKQLVSYLSVIVIALLGVSIFLGLDYSSVFIRKNASDYFSAQQVRDIELLSTLLFSQDDLVDIRSTEGVIDPEGVLQVRGLASSGGDLDAIGRLYHLQDPKSGEALAATDAGILIQKRVSEAYGLSPGSEIEIAHDGARHSPGPGRRLRDRLHDLSDDGSALPAACERPEHPSVDHGRCADGAVHCGR